MSSETSFDFDPNALIARIHRRIVDNCYVITSQRMLTPGVVSRFRKRWYVVMAQYGYPLPQHVLDEFKGDGFTITEKAGK